MKESWSPSHLGPIPPDECLQLLADEPVGRVAYCDLHGPVVPPVNHVLDGGAIWFRTSPYSELARHLRHAGREAAVRWTSSTATPRRAGACWSVALSVPGVRRVRVMPG